MEDCLQFSTELIERRGDVERYRDAVREGVPGTSSKVLLVGEHNPYGPATRNQLVCWPDGCAGHRLQSSILGISVEEYLGLWRTNLCGGRGWIMKEARARASDLRHPDAPWDTIVLLGRKVATAFDLKDLPPFRRTEWRRFHLITLPHPSGLCREWNKPGARVAARSLLRWCHPDVIWGSLA